MDYGSKLELTKRTYHVLSHGWTRQIVKNLIDTLWREPVLLRWSGFENAGATDAIFSWNDSTKIFSVAPANKLFSFYQYKKNLSYHIINEQQQIDLSAEITEGLYVFYFDFSADYGAQRLLHIFNPSTDELKFLFLYRTIVSFMYWDYTNQKALTIGNDCHGSLVNPHQQWVNHETIHGQRNPNGLSVTGMQINEDGSSADHAQFSVTAGSFWHDDFEITILSGGGNSAMPVMYFASGKPRFILMAGFQVYAHEGVLSYNAGADFLAVSEMFHVCYHVFATNDRIEGQQLISVMGPAQYELLAEAFAEAKNEVNSIFQAAPQHGLCYLGTVIYQSSANYTNSVKARIVGFVGEVHPPVTIAPGSEGFLEINDKQELSFNPNNIDGGSGAVRVNQVNHGFILGNPIRDNGSGYVSAQANNAVNAQVCGVVSRIIDADNFEYLSDGWIPGYGEEGSEYFLSPSVAGGMFVLEDPEIWNVGEVRISLGWATLYGFKVNIDVGDEIGVLPVLTGSQGPQGYQGSASMVPGPQGFQGSASTVPGPQGYQGVKGVGEQGAQGYQGKTGIGQQGPQGYQGNIGVASTVPGPQGLKGSTGSTGPQGNRGYQGYKGSTGATGSQGLRGYQGSTGSTGAASTIPGPQGSTGSTGPQGTMGYQGYAGSTGSQGPRGYQGVAGSNASCLWETVDWAFVRPKGTYQGTILNGPCVLAGDPYVGFNRGYMSDTGWNTMQTGYSSVLSQDKSNGYLNFSLLSSVSAGTGSVSTKTIRFYNLSGNITTPGTISSGNFILNSERKLKKDIKSIGVLDIADIPLRQFVFKNDKDKRVRYGAIIDEVEKIAPNLVYRADDGSKQLAYIDLLIAKVAVLEDEVYNLKHRQ